MADDKTPPSIETDPETFITLWKTMGDKQRAYSPEKVRGIRIWSHDIREAVEDAGFGWTNAGGDELTGGKMTRFLTRMKVALERNLQRFDGMDAQETFKLVNGQGSHGQDGYVRSMFVKIEEVKEIVEESEWGSFKDKLGIK